MYFELLTVQPERIDPPDPRRPDYDIRADVWSLGLSLVLKQTTHTQAATHTHTYRPHAQSPSHLLAADIFEYSV